MDAHVFANFRVTNSNINPRFPYEGTWYEYFTGDSIVVTDLNDRIDLGPGDYRVYTTVRITPPNGFFTSIHGPEQALPLEIRPNPVSRGDRIDVTWSIERNLESIELISADGRQVPIAIEDQGDIIRLEPAADTPPGVYLIRIVSGDGLYLGRVVIGG